MKAGRRLARAGGLRQPDPQEGDAGHDRHLHQPGRGAGAERRGAAAVQPQLRIRQRDRPLRALPARGNPSRRSRRRYNLRTDGNSRAIGGASSGAIAAFAAAWERPDAFSRVFSTIGTYVGLRGGNDFPTLIRKTEPKPLRVFLQDGSNDLNNYGGNWLLANQEMLSALRVRRLRRRARVGRRRARQQARRVDPARRAALALARLPGPDRARRRIEAAA